MTHTLFPLFGYLLAYVGITELPVLTPIIGLVAFFFIAYFIFQEVMAQNSEDEAGQVLVTLGLILAVSWDALWSGPAKSAQVVGWPEFWVWLSFVVVGLVVMLCASFSLLIARFFSVNTASHQRFKRLKEILNRILPSVNMGQWLQISIVGYFGFLALIRYTFSLDISEWKLLSFSLVFMALLLRWKHKPKILLAARTMN